MSGGSRAGSARVPGRRNVGVIGLPSVPATLRLPGPVSSEVQPGTCFLSNAHNATDGSGVLVVLVRTRKLVGTVAESRSFLGRTREPY